MANNKRTIDAADKGHTLTTKRTEELKDEFGRLPDEAYTPSTIGFNLGKLLRGAHIPLPVGRELLRCIQGKEPLIPALVVAMSSFDECVADLFKVFTEHNATKEEVILGAAYLEDLLPENNLVITKEVDADDSKTLH